MKQDIPFLRTSTLQLFAMVGLAVQLLPATPPPCRMEEEQGTGFLGSFESVTPHQNSSFILPFSCKALSFRFAYNPDIGFLFNFCFGWYLLSGFLVHFL